MAKHERITPEELKELTTAYREVATGDDEDSVARRRQLLREIKKCRHEDQHPNEPTYEFDVPRAADGSYFKINDQIFFGKMTLPRCVVAELAYRIDQNYRVDRERLRETKFGFDLDKGIVGERARLIPQD